MAALLDLPDEAIGRILDCISERRSGFRSISEWKTGGFLPIDLESLGNLSLTCRRLSALCTPKIWDEFQVRIRECEPGDPPTAMARIRNVLETPHLLNLIREATIFREPSTPTTDEPEDPVFTPDFFHALSDLVRSTKSLRALTLLGCPDSRDFPRSYNGFWISIFASRITQLSFGGSHDFGVRIDPGLIPRMATSEIKKLELIGGNAYQSLSSLSFLSNLTKVQDLSFVDCLRCFSWPSNPSARYPQKVPAPNPSFWQGIRRLTLRNLHEKVLSQVVEWIDSSREEAGQGTPAQTGRLEYLNIGLDRTSDMHPILARFSSPRIKGLGLTLARNVQVDSSFISYVAELFPSLKTLALTHSVGRSYAQGIANSASGFESHKHLENLSFTGCIYYDDPLTDKPPFEGRIPPEAGAAVMLDQIRRQAEDIGLPAIARSCSILKQVGPDDVAWDVIRRRVQNEGQDEVNFEPYFVDYVVW